ncbi:hypothetical protein SSX86_018176 [Deinandra increscens subsp. villosa]|uniref:F-box domain-containing protein n=1 Tax=Deinandra increscens subsp. villosa TaxID=3103831 RepID=A0AAP0CRW4_9ASTR
MMELPADLILSDILPRLPAKSVVRFRSVCKQWNSFLKTSMFYNLHHHHLLTGCNMNTRYHHQKLLVSIKNPSVKLFSIDCEAPDDGFLRHVTPAPLEEAICVSILTSCNGMTCLGMRKEKEWMYDMVFDDLILWNPFTSEYKRLSKTNSHAECYMETYDGFTMYYSSSEDDYRILRTVKKSGNAYIYSLKSDSWRKLVITTSAAVALGSYNWMPSVVLDEKVFILNSYEEDIWIIRFDTKTEKFTKMETHFRKRKFSRHVIDRGCFHVRVRHCYSDGMGLEVLRMNGDGDWTVMGTYFVKGDLDPYKFQPLHLMSNGNWLMRYQGCLYNVDMNMVNNGNNCDPLNGKEEMCITTEVKYIETFVSPNRYMQTSS